MDLHAAYMFGWVGPNDYGHPHPEGLSTFQGTGAKVLRTDNWTTSCWRWIRPGRYG